MFDIDEAIEALDEAVGNDGPPVWAAFDRDDGIPEGFVLRQDPDGILGWRAPAECWAVGVVSGATAWLVGDPGDGGERCRVACVVDRWGSVSARVHFADGRVVGDAPEAGRVIDMLSRCLGVQTPPADDGPAHTLSLLWLAALAGEQGGAGQQIGWGDAIALHPVVQLLEWDPAATPHRSAYGGDGQRLAGPPERIGDPSASVVVAAARRWSWADVRQRCIGAQVPLGDVSPDLAAWMDDGMLSRWLDQDGQPVALLVDTAFEVLRPEDHTALRRVLLAACGAARPGSDIRRHRHRRGSTSSSGALRPGS